jgi:hypothetical protein
MPRELINYAGTGEGCPICDDGDVPFLSDEAAVAHYVTHSPGELAFALLHHKAIIQRALVAVDDPGGIRTERHMDEIIAEVNDTGRRSPARTFSPR